MTGNSNNTTVSSATEDDSILSFLTTDFLESQTTNPAAFDSTQFFDSLPSDNNNNNKYQDLLHPPSPPTSVGTFSESSGSPQHSNVDSCDEGSGSEMAMDNNPLEYWQYVYSDLTQPSASFPLLADPTQQQLQQQPGAWPLLPNVDAALLQPSIVPTFGTGALFDSNNNNTSDTHTANSLGTNDNSVNNMNSSTNSNNNNNNNNNTKRSYGAGAPNTPPSPAVSIKAEKKTKRIKKQAPAAPHTASLLPLAPLKPLITLAPQPTPPSPPVSVHDTFIKQSPPLSPCIVPAPLAAGAPTGGSLRRPSIIPVLTPSLTRSNPVIVKSTLLPDEKPQSEAVMTAQAKRQERLIKNRAAALLSRKRKREHISLLESHTDLLKNDNQELKERVSELEENVKVLTEERDTARHERDSARQECERLHRQITVLTHRSHSQSDNSILMDMDLERNIRTADAERGLNSKATGVVFMIILFSFALFNLPSGKLETLMVGGSLDRARIGSSIVGRALNSYTKNPTISGQVPESPATRQDLNNMTDLVVFSDNRALQSWLGHEPVSISSKATAEAPVVASATIPEKQMTRETLPLAADETTKSVGFVSQGRESLPWTHTDVPKEMNEPDRDAWLYCSNLLYSLRSTAVTKAAGSGQATNGEIRRPRISFISPLDGVAGSTPTEKGHLPPWMPNADPTESESEQRYLRLDVEVTSSRVVSGKGLGDHEQVIRFPLMPVGVFDNSTTSLTPSKAAEATPVAAAPGQSSSSSRSQRTSYRARSSRVNSQGGVVKARRIYDTKDQLFKNARAAASQAGSSASHAEASTPLTPIKEEPMEIYIKEEPMD